jgi:hypothetical protein
VTPPAGDLEAAVERYVEPLDLPEHDPRALVGGVAVRLARELDRRVTAAMARELRGCLVLLAELSPDESVRAAAQGEALLRSLRELVKR